MVESEIHGVGAVMECGGRISGLTGVPRSSGLTWWELPFGAYPSGVQMEKYGATEIQDNCYAYLPGKVKPCASFRRGQKTLYTRRP